MDSIDRAAKSSSDYHEFRAPERLREHLVCFWAQRVSSPVEFSQPVFPDGCVDLLLINGVPTVIGPWTGPFVSALAPGTEIAGARLQPGTAASLLGLPASELMNLNLPLNDIWDSQKRSAFARVADEVTLSGRIFAMESAILARLADVRGTDGAMQAAVRWIARRPRGRVEELSQWLGISTRQLQRRFTAAVGYGPKTFQSVLRFQRLLDLAARTSDGCSLADMAALAGYADQAHMTRETQRFAGMTPTVALSCSRSTLRLSGLIHSAHTPLD